MTIAMGNGNTNSKGMNFDGGIMTVPAEKYEELLEIKIKYNFLLNYISNLKYSVTKEEIFGFLGTSHEEG